MNEQSSISIINRTNGQLTGENAQALPIQIKTSFSWVKIFIAGFITAIFIIFIFVYYVKKQVVVVEVSGKSADYQEYKIQ